MVHQQPAPPSTHFHLAASTTQHLLHPRILPSSFLGIRQHNPYRWLQELSNGSNSHWHLCNQYATLSQHQPHLSRGPHLLINTISIRLSHMGSPTGLSQAPLKQHFPTFHYRTSSFCCLPIFSLLAPSKQPPKDKQDFNRFQESSSHIIFPFRRKFPLSEIVSFSPILKRLPPSQRYMQFQ